ncbi:hypothetical protein [Planomonospora parontospora]|uniref:hypothetical protein n=1 Tax=Planomonospora parontospora TaxID=58119 RepID=UPI00166F7FAE|nr:hypothetical protein [Planomonospora parontospora]GGL55330.1 hypothetical protein GCM10014719_65760 [Planomonospora parontospora subsp. antibiotica]GII19802.1 hypothetical protein Ppa05_65280 [Planomonospora parontospora subsp. antibiotica]
MTAIPAVHPDAVALTVFRDHRGQPRTYTIAEAPGGRGSIERSVLIATKLGFIRVPEPGQVGYAVLDLLDRDDQPVQELCIPTRRAFTWWYRTLGLRVEATG